MSDHSDHSRRESEADPTADAIIGLLRVEGSAELPHGGGRTLLDHLLGTYAVARRWGQPRWLQHAALLHSVYGTDVYQRQLFARARRADVAAVAGDEAERIAYLFCVTPRRPLFAGTHLWARGLPTLSADGDSHDPSDPPPTREELDAVVLVHMANLAEQSRAGDGSPGLWLTQVAGLAELLDADRVTLPSFVRPLGTVEETDESRARRAYADAIGTTGEARAAGLALAAAACPVVPEPCVWLAHGSRCRDDGASAESWAELAARRLAALGTPWDKRLAFDEWRELIERLGRPLAGDPTPAADAIGDPRTLYDAIVPRTSAASVTSAITPPDPATGRRRFHRYLDGLADPEASGVGGIYPDLPSRPWHNPADFPLVNYLESHFPAIRDEILALDAGRFHRESERIDRTGDWNVAFLYERGRRRDEACAALPVTARGIEAHSTVRTLAGLIYVSRMRAGTEIGAHRGPTNLRLRCHLGITVPDGDCAIRVGERARRWQEGRCLVFDDSFLHEAWNRAEQDRTVLIVDVWHPGLSPTEVMLLEALHGYADAHARRLSRYWAANAAAARQAEAEARSTLGH